MALSLSKCLQVPVSISQIKQIAGRAGRRNSIYPKGYATTLQAADLPRVKAAVDAPMSALGTQAAGLFPEFQHLELLGGQVGADPLDSFSFLRQQLWSEALKSETVGLFSGTQHLELL